MPAGTNIYIDAESGRLGELWRSQSEGFRQEQAEVVMADVERLRESFIAGLAAAEPRPRPRRAAGPPQVIDLRDEDLSGMGCSREGHGYLLAVARCSRCHDVFCAGDIVRPEATRGQPLCTDCALLLVGVHHKKNRPLRARSR